jgi:hypothetical protein
MDEKTINEHEIEIPCNQCFKQTKKTLGWLNDNRNIDVVCDHCGAIHKFDKKAVREVIEQLRNVP